MNIAVTSMSYSLRVALLGIISLGLFGCGSDSEPEPADAPPTPTPVVADNECGYDQQCADKLDVATCEQARCIEGACEVVALPAQALCTLATPVDCGVGRCDGEKNCKAVSARDGEPCNSDSWDVCTGYTCEAGQCVERDLQACNDDNPCTEDNCTKADGCTHTPIEGSCDDGDPCSLGDICVEGVCTGQEQCECMLNEDCAVLEDEDLCNGTLVCDTETFKCVVDESTVITCEGTTDDPCTQVACIPSTGLCAETSSPDYVVCEDGNPCTGCVPGTECTQHDFCQDGVCIGGLGEPCTCTEDLDCANLDDDDLCNGTWHCVDGLCEVDATSTIDCSDQEAPTCQEIQCNSDSGACEAVASEDGTTCDDGNSCTTEDSCMEGECAAGSTLEDGSACDDGNEATSDDICTAGVCAGTAADLCADVTCTAMDDCHEAGTCDPTSGTCSNPAKEDGTSCDDGDDTTTDDVCTAGVCAGSTPDLCAGVTCTAMSDCHDAGTCDPTNGTCSNPVKEDGTSCDDGDDATTDDVCTAGVCAGETAATVTEVSIVSMSVGFDPASLEVTVGTTVRWTNNDSMGHSVKSRAADGSVDAAGPLNSPLLSSGDTWEFTFETAGEYPYRCGPHAGMTGTVIVSD